MSLLNEERYCWFPQKEATIHTADTTLTLLKEFFDSCLIIPPPWPPRSPVLTPPDFFLWGYIKDRIFHEYLPGASDKLEAKIIEAIEVIEPSTLKKVFTNRKKRIDVCIGVNGIISNILYKFIVLYVVIMFFNIFH